jgi:hypothetical protein
MPGFPKVLSVYKKQFVEPWRTALSEALRAVRKSRTLPGAAAEEILLDAISGAVMQRILMRTQAPSDRQERAWVRSLLRQLGLAPKSGRSRLAFGAMDSKIDSKTR